MLPLCGGGGVPEGSSPPFPFMLDLRQLIVTGPILMTPLLPAQFARVAGSPNSGRVLPSKRVMAEICAPEWAVSAIRCIRTRRADQDRPGRDRRPAPRTTVRAACQAGRMPALTERRPDGRLIPAGDRLRRPRAAGPVLGRSPGVPVRAAALRLPQLG